MKLSIIIPVYNEEKTILSVLKKVISEPLVKWEKEIIIVNDASTDATFKEISKVMAKNSNIKLITHVKNLGKGAAIRTGIKKVSSGYVLIQDADQEYDPRFYSSLLSRLENSQSVVYGSRLMRLPDFKKSETNLLFFIHYCGNRILSLLVSILYGCWLTDIETGYKLIPRNAFESISLLGNGFEIEPEITVKLLKKGYTIHEVPITTTPRGYAQGKKLHTFRDGAVAIWTIIKYRFID